MNFLSYLFLLFTVCLLTGRPAFADELILDDFDGESSLGQTWAAAGGVKVARQDVPEPRVNGKTPGPRGKALHIVTDGNFAIYTKVPTPVGADWKKAEEIAFWVYQAEDRDSRVDVLALEADRKALFWRKCEISGNGWQRITLPLRWFRWEDRRLPRWSEVKHFGFRGGAGLDLWIDAIGLVDEEPEQGSLLTVEELSALAFPGAGTEAFRRKADDRVWLLSDAPELDVEALHGHLAKVRSAVEADIPRWKGRGETPRLLVFEDQLSYRAFFKRMGDKLSAKIVPPRSGGYHVMGTGVSYWDETWKSLRPVFTHEFVHSIATFNGLQGSSGGDWFQEGLANLYQLRFHPQEGIEKIIVEGIGDATFRTPLTDLCSGKNVPLNRYWQAMSVVDYLLTQPGFELLLKRMEGSGSVNLSDHVEAAFGCGMEDLERRWLAFAAEKYAE